MPKITLKDGTQFIVDKDIYFKEIFPLDENDTIQLGKNFFKKRSIDSVLNDEISTLDDGVYKKQISTNSDTIYVNFGRRFLAYIIDIIIISLLSTIIIVGKMENDSFNFENYELISRFYGWLVGVIYFVMTYNVFGNTLGKFIFRIKLIKKDTNDVPGVWTLIGRSLFLGFPLQLGFLLIPFNEERKAVHDHIFKTRVVYIRALSNLNKDI